MSAEATGWVYRHSPFTGATFTVHLAMADSVNDAHNHDFWMRQARLGEKARVSRSACNEALWVLTGQPVKYGNGTRGPTTSTVFVQDFGAQPGHRGVHRYRFLFPNVPVVYETRPVAVDNTSPVAVVDTSLAEVLSLTTGTCRQGQQVPVVYGDTEPKREPKKNPSSEERLRGVLPPVAFDPSPESKAWATAKYPRVDIDTETVKFVNHHRAKGNRFKDMQAAWRNWIIKADEFMGGRPDGRHGDALVDTDRDGQEGLILL